MTQATATNGIVNLDREAAERQRRNESLWSRAMRRLRHDYLTLLALGVLLTLTVLSVFAPVITRNILQVDGELTNPSDRLLAPGTPGHILGTDDLGRDYAARLLHGGQISLAIGFSGAIITLLIGVATGLVSGYYGGVIDDVMNWIITTLDSIPVLYLLLLLAQILTQSPTTLVLVIALTGWTGGSRLVRGQTIYLRNQEYVTSAQALGASPWRVMFIHILPNMLSQVFLALAFGIGGLILVESTLSFLGFGVQPPTPTWGNMLVNAQQFFTRGPHMATISGLLIFVTVLSLFVIGDGLRDAFDPRVND